jgi:hypothetical protein
MASTPAFARPDADQPSLATECAGVLLQRHLVAESNMVKVIASLQEQPIVPETVVATLMRDGLVAPENRAIATEFIKRTVQRYR